MAKPKTSKGTKLTDAQKRRMGLVGKALSAQVDGESICDREFLGDVGAFDETIVVMARVAGFIGEDGKADRFLGCSFNFLIDVLIGSMPGFTKDFMMRLTQIAAELKRADVEGRKPRSITWQDSEGRPQTCGGEELKALKDRIQERKDQLKQETEEGGSLSKFIKAKVPVKGRCEIAVFECNVLHTGQAKRVVEESGRDLVKLKETTAAAQAVAAGGKVKDADRRPGPSTRAKKKAG